jgi:hypothetical protein
MALFLRYFSPGSFDFISTLFPFYFPFALSFGSSTFRLLAELVTNHN